MANLEVLALDTAVPQIRAPGAGDGYSVPRDMTLSAGTTLTAPTVAVSTGNLTFSSTGQRITGDMSNATIANRLMFQTTTANLNTSVSSIPNGTATGSAFNAHNASDPTNSGVFQLLALSTEMRLNANAVGTGTPLPMTFYTGGSERMRLDTSGNLGIGGTANDWARLAARGTFPTSSNVSQIIEVRGTIPSGSTTSAYSFNSNLATQAASFTCSNVTHFRVDALTIGAGSAVTNQYGFFVPSGHTTATNNYGFYSDIASGSNRWNFYANGTAQNYFAGETLVGGTTDQGAYNLQCNGTGVWGAGAYVNGSDARLKDNIQSLDSGLDVVKAIRPVTFQYKPEYSKDQSVQPGFIAQELQTAMAGKPYLEGVVQEGTNHLNVAYQNIIPILVKAIQELEAKVAALEAK